MRNMFLWFGAFKVIALDLFAQLRCTVWSMEIAIANL